MHGAIAIGFILDMLIGDPEWFPHPVRYIGKWISFAEGVLRKKGGNLRTSAVWLTISTVIVTVSTCALVLFLLSCIGKWALFVGVCLLNWMGFSMKCLAKEANGVAAALDEGLEAGRKRVARIVGRDTDTLTEEEIIKATIETVAENTSDGVVSPMFYSLLGGPLLLWAFKAVSTLDSMVGYMDDKYRDIGWFSAKLDDVLNFIPARLTAICLCASAWFVDKDAKNAWKIMRRDHKNHKSPNCAWPEAAVAGALHIQLGGTHDYFGVSVEKPTIGDDLQKPTRLDIKKTNYMMYFTCLIVLALFMKVDLIMEGFTYLLDCLHSIF